MPSTRSRVGVGVVVGQEIEWFGVGDGRMYSMRSRERAMMFLSRS